MSNEKTNPPISVSAKAELKGEVSTGVLDRAVNALVDAVAPFTEGMGLIGDHIRAHRYDVAIQIAERARQLAAQRNMKLSPPPLKFMVPFLEKASTETIDNELMEMWARLLVDAADEFQGVHLTYIQILSEISSFEAQYLNKVARDWDVDIAVPPPVQMAEQYKNQISESLAGYNLASKEIDTKRLESGKDAESLIDFMYGVETKEYCKPISVSVPYTSPEPSASEVYTTKGAHATTAYLLQRQDLLKIEEVTIPSRFGLIKTEVACLTTLGQDFLVSCMGR